MDRIDRNTARAIGSKTFYTGKPCIHGHDSERYVLNGSCKACVMVANGRIAKVDSTLLLQRHITEVGAITVRYQQAMLELQQRHASERAAWQTVRSCPTWTCQDLFALKPTLPIKALSLWVAAGVPATLQMVDAGDGRVYYRDEEMLIALQLYIRGE